MRVITVSNLKGGAGKTTTSAYLAHALQDLGLAVLAIDADPQHSLLEWSRQAAWSIPVRAMTGPALDTNLAGLQLDGLDMIVIDTPPDPHNVPTVMAAMRAADIIVLTTAPTTAEVRRVRATTTAAAGADASHKVRVLMNRTINRAASTGDTRAALTASGLTVMAAEIPRREALAQADGFAVERGQGFMGYTAAALELVA